MDGPLLKAAFYFFSSNCNDPITINKFSGPWTRQVPPRVGRPVYGQVRCGLDGQAGSLLAECDDVVALPGRQKILDHEDTRLQRDHLDRHR